MPEELPLVCFTIMPSGFHKEYQGEARESDFIYKHIIERGVMDACRRLDREIRTIREVDRALPGSITNRIIRHLADSDFVIADITGRNPNVFLELGIRYALCPTGTILLRQEEAEIPFDIANFKVISYDKYKPGEAALSIGEYIANSSSDSNIDSPVFDAIKQLEVHGEGIKIRGEISIESRVVMTWKEIMNRIYKLDFYDEHYNSGTFTPDAIIGITNGGLIMAEIISRKYFRRVPLVSLWADRWSSAGLNDPSSHYFNNAFAKAAISPLKELMKGKEYLTLLVIDDNVASGITCQHAVRFLREELGQTTRIVFQPLVCKVPDYLLAVEEVLPTSFGDNLFKLGKDEFLSQLITDKLKFPYDKDIRG